MSKDLLTVRQGLRVAEKLLADVLQRDYPIGGTVRWERGGRIHRGRVVMHGHFDRIRVRNEATEAALWIHAGDICRAVETISEMA
jgi:hypothetical protein